MTSVDTEALVIGAGPVGLFQAFQLGLQGVSVQLVDALPHPGGQCVELYGDKPIYDIPGIPVCSGRELTDRLLAQLSPFRPTMHLGQQVQTLLANPDGSWQLATDHGLSLRARAVFIAAGVGAFVPRRVALDGLATFEGTQVHYHAWPADPLQWRAGQTDGRLVVMGGEADAVDTALTLARHAPGRVTLLHRTDRFKVDSALAHALQQAQAEGRLCVQIGQPVGLQTVAEPLAPCGQRLIGLLLALPGDQTDTLPVDQLLPRLGLSPKLGPVADWGLAMARKLLSVNPATCATNVPGIYAVGDVADYPGKRKLILCGFHEATLATFAALEYLRPGERVLLQYTTTSPALQERLGVRPPPTA